MQERPVLKLNLLVTAGTSFGIINENQPIIYGCPHNGKKLTDSLDIRKAPVVVYSTSIVDSFVARADMESEFSLRLLGLTF
jgi:hypothetical protein